jgi:hypothetical protein
LTSGQRRATLSASSGFREGLLTGKILVSAINPESGSIQTDVTCFRPFTFRAETKPNNPTHRNRVPASEMAGSTMGGYFSA